MSRLRGWLHRLRVGVRRAEYERELGEEIRFHLELEAQQQRAAGTAGEGESTAAARRRFGNVTYVAEEVQAMSGFSGLDALGRDVRFALRSLRRAPGFATAVLATLAIGIGANTAIFSFVRGVLLRPLPFPEDGRLVVLRTQLKTGVREGASLPDYLDWASKTRSFTAMGAYARTRLNIALPGAAPERAATALVTADLFPALRLGAELGRLPTAADEVYGAHHVVVLSDAFWRRAFGADPAIIGRTIRLNEVPYTVIGVAPPALQALVAADLWAPLAISPAVTPQRRGDFLQVVARLAPGVGMEAAQADASRLATELQAAYPVTNDGIGIAVESLRETIVGGARLTLLTLAAAVGLLLLIACANVANLMLARATARSRELAVRVALGAGRRRLVRQLLTESVTLAVLGGGGGLVLAFWGIQTLRAAAPPDMPRLEAVHMDPVVLAFAGALTVLTAVAFGLAPALRSSGEALHDQLAHGARGNAGGRSDRLRGALVFVQTALALVLAVGAGLLARSFARLQAVPLGFDPVHVLTAQALISSTSYPTAARQLAFFEGVRDSMRAAPGVQQAALATDLPLVPNYSYLSFAVVGRTPPARGEPLPDAIVTEVDSAFFATMRIPVRDGRTFTSADRAAAPRVAVVNEEMVRRWFGGSSPVGERITLGDPLDPSTWITIVGVVGTTRLEGVGADAYPQLFLSMAQYPQRAMYVVIRTAGDPAATLPVLRRAVAGVDPAQPLGDAATMDQRVARALAPARLNSRLIGAFSVIALVLAAVGIYGVVSYAVSRRTREIGIRMALGAGAGDVIRLIVRRGMAPAFGGVAIGLVAAVLLAHLARGMLYGVDASDPVSLAGAAFVLSAIAAIASLVPGLRAARVRPVEALSEE